MTEPRTAAQQWLDAQPAPVPPIYPALWNPSWQREHEAWLQHGPTHVRAILAIEQADWESIRPYSLDEMCDDPTCCDKRAERIARAHHAARLRYPTGTYYCGDESGPFEFDSGPCSCRMDAQEIAAIDVEAELAAALALLARADEFLHQPLGKSRLHLVADIGALLGQHAAEQKQP